jgi:hypothetical protein
MYNTVQRNYFMTKINFFYVSATYFDPVGV